MPTTLAPDERDALVQQLHERTRSAGFHYLDAAQLSEIAAYHTDGAPVVSLFMKLTPEMRVGEAWQTQFKDLQRQALGQTNGTYSQQDVQAELDRIEAALRTGIPRTGRGVAFFASSGLGLMRQYGTPMELPNEVHVGTRAHVRPLARIRDEHDRFGIALLSQKHMRFFFSQIGLVEEVFAFQGREILTDDFASKDQRQDKQQEYRKEQAERAAHAMQLLAKELGVRHLLYSAPADMERPFLDALDQSAREKIVGNFGCDTLATTAEVAEKAEAVQREVEAREELETLDRVQAQLTGRAVTGLEDTLEMLNQQRVMTLVINDALTLEGGVDPATGMLTQQTSGTYAATSNPVQKVPDLIDRMLEKAMEQGASLELVRSEAAQAKMDAMGPAAALLRF